MQELLQHRADPYECAFPVPGELTGMIGDSSGGRKLRPKCMTYIWGKGGREGVISVVMESGMQNISY